jgi:hypothetical protein
MRRDTLSIRGLALAAVAALACVAASAWAQGPAASQPAVLVDRKEGVPGLKALKERKGAGADEAVKSAADRKSVV